MSETYLGKKITKIPTVNKNESLSFWQPKKKKKFKQSKKSNSKKRIHAFPVRYPENYSW